MNKDSQRGSAILMLFIAVALFGLLSYAFLQGSRTSTTIITSEKAKSNAKEIVAYANDLRMAVTRLKARGCADEQISLKNDVVTGYDNTNNPPVSCEIFNVAGGGIKFKGPIANDGSNWIFTGKNRLHTSTTGTNNIGDLVAVLGGVDPDTCKAINQMNSITSNTSDGIPREADHFSLEKFTGTYLNSYALNTTETSGQGKSFGCVKSITASPPVGDTQPNVLYFFSGILIR